MTTKPTRRTQSGNGNGNRTGKSRQRQPMIGPKQVSKVGGRRSSSGVGRGKGSPGRPRKISTGAGSGSTPIDSRLALVRNSAANMLAALGGRDRLVEILADSGHPKAQKLLDRLNDSTYAGEHFTLSYNSVGLKSYDIVEIFDDVQRSRTFIAALTESGEVMMSLVRAAKDQLEEHDRCDGTGKKLDSKGKATVVDCVKCRGTGFLLKSGARDAQELYFELIKWKQGGGVNLNLDNRRQSVHFGSGGAVVGALPGQSPDVLSIIKRADQVRGDAPMQLPAAPAAKVEVIVEVMPEDVLEAEPV